MRKKIVLTFVFVMITVFSADAKDRAELRYNDVIQKASHNSYQKKENVVVQLNDWNIRTIEFDGRFKSSSPLSKETAPDGDWFVYHKFGDDWSNCQTMSECFSNVAEFHEMKPDHQVVTIFFDITGVGEPGHTKDDFNRLIENSFPKGSVASPSDFMQACPSAKDLQGAVTNEGCGWPKLDSLKGKFIFVISDGRQDFVDGGYDINKDLVFLVNKHPTEAKMYKEKNRIFFNMSGADEIARTVHDKGFVSRCYYINKAEKYEKAKNNGANLLAIDDLDPQKYPWSNTTQSDGFPFEVIK